MPKTIIKKTQPIITSAGSQQGISSNALDLIHQTKTAIDLRAWDKTLL
jgi:hypothetical protein